jgi:fumarate hydratase subunit alpha
VRQGYTDGYLRASIVRSPLDRVNTGDNTPAVIHVDVVPGAELKLAIMAKGGGCENRSKYTMLTPAAGLDGVKDFVIECVKTAGPDACPPLILGVGVGGTFEKSAILSKKALFREVGSANPDPALDASRRSSWRAPTGSASARRAMAATRRRSASTSSPIPATSRRCQWR